ncbi:MAG TPA: class I SAM-dependent methyltransferase [Spirochaetia bacterium]|nr:class I SAM-dependent methyltransferase [Spirochaetia bacterium]
MKTFSKSPGSERLVAVPCDLCGRESTRPLYGPRSLWVRCTECGLVYQNPQPVREELLGRYDDAYFNYEIENETGFFELMKLGLADIHFQEIESTLGDTRSFLDVGCATGMLIEWAKSRGWREKGVEVCSPAAEYGRNERGVDIFAGVLEEARFEDASLDVVHCSHLIEHLNDPHGFVQEAKRILAPGGYFIITTPNIDGLQSRLFRADWRSLIADHLYLFSASTLERLLRKQGFEILRRKTWGGLGVGTAPPWIKRSVDRLAKRFGFGDVVIVLARKPESARE